MGPGQRQLGRVLFPMPVSYNTCEPGPGAEYPNMPKVLQPTAKRKSATTAKKARKRAPASARGNKPAKPNLCQMNAWLNRNRELVMQRAKQNALRLIGREVL